MKIAQGVIGLCPSERVKCPRYIYREAVSISVAFSMSKSSREHVRSLIIVFSLLAIGGGPRIHIQISADNSSSTGFSSCRVKLS